MFLSGEQRKNLLYIDKMIEVLNGLVSKSPISNIYSLHSVSDKRSMCTVTKLSIIEGPFFPTYNDKKKLNQFITLNILVQLPNK